MLGREEGGGTSFNSQAKALCIPTKQGYWECEWWPNKIHSCKNLIKY